MANILGQISGLYMSRKAQTQQKEFFDRKLTLKDLQMMDTGKSGAVTYDEFLIFMLVTMGKVEMDDVKEIENLYKKLDRDHNGQLSINDLFDKAYGSKNEGQSEIV